MKSERWIHFKGWRPGVVFLLGLVFTGASLEGVANPKVTLAWDANSESDLAGYKVYYGAASGTYTNTADVGNVTAHIVPGLVKGATYFFVVTAYNTSGLESEPSNEVSYSVPPPTSLEIWRAQYFNQATLSDSSRESTVWGDLADPDRDGLNNLMEFALGIDPIRGDIRESVLASNIAESGGNKYLVLSFRRRRNEPLLLYRPEVSPDEQTWQSGPGYVSETVSPDSDPEFEIIHCQDLVVVSPGSPRFCRLKVIKN